MSFPLECESGDSVLSSSKTLGTLVQHIVAEPTGRFAIGEAHSLGVEDISVGVEDLGEGGSDHRSRVLFHDLIMAHLSHNYC